MGKGASRGHHGPVKWLFALFVVLCGAAAAFALFSDHAYHKSVLTNDVDVVIAPHTRTRDLLVQLNEVQALPAPWKISLPLLWRKQYRSLKAGEYHFTTGMTAAQVLEKITRGEVVVHKLTAPEGWTVGQIKTALLAEPLLTGEVPAVIAEGSLFPDTVIFTRGESRGQIVTRMQGQMTEVLNTLWVARAPELPLTTPEQALVLASIVEKETGLPEERPLVAAVYVNRLKKGMKLQADPTVAYGVDPSGPMNRPLSNADLARDTPYNTYVRGGLPPTPICNPGRASIEATLHPAQSDALYFVATGNGGHRFAATMNEHEKNVAAYRKLMRAEQAPPPAPEPVLTQKKKSARKKRK